MDKKEICKKIKEINHKIVIVGPTLKDENDPDTHLRVYYKGGRLANIGTGKREKSALMSKKYENQFKDNIEKTKKFNDIRKKAASNEENLIKVLSNKENFKLINEAFERKWQKMTKKEKNNQKERDVETQIMSNFMISENDWIAVDMEFQCPSSWFEKMDSDKEIKKFIDMEHKKGNKKITKKPKFDIIMISKDGIGIIELKVNNENCDNILSHYCHMKHILNNEESKDKFITEIYRRIKYLQENELINSEIIDKYGKQFFNEKKLWCGFLFVGGGKSESVKIIRGLEEKLEEKEFIKNLNFMYCDNDESKIKTLNINHMQNYNDFIKESEK